MKRMGAFEALTGISLISFTLAIQFLTGAEANDISRTNVPNTRMDFRYKTLVEELQFITDNFTGGK